MTSLHHPSDETLLRHAAGVLGPGPSVVVEAHLGHCFSCRAALGEFEAIGGALLEAMPPGEAPADGLARALAAIDRGGFNRPAPAVAPRRARPDLPAGFELPSSLSDTDFGRWRWIAPGIHISRAEGAWARAADLKLLRVEPGKRLLTHGHDGIEWTCILSGAFSDGRARFVAGDFSEVDQTVEHRPIIEGDAACICLVAMEGRMKPHGLIGRLHQMVFDA